MVNLLMFWTGVAFWVVCALVGVFALYDIILWRVVDFIFKRYKMQEDLFAYLKDRWQKKSGRYPA